MFSGAQWATMGYIISLYMKFKVSRIQLIFSGFYQEKEETFFRSE